jgi:hypothetical protein
MELVKPKYSTHASSIPTVTKVYISSLKKSGDNKRKEKKNKNKLAIQILHCNGKGIYCTSQWCLSLAAQSSNQT